jgi:AraC-like DNA-binding protein
MWSWRNSDSVALVVRVRKPGMLTLFLCSNDPAHTCPGDPLSRRYLSYDVPVASRWSKISVALSDFEPPAWWLQLHPDLPDPRRKFLDRVSAMQIGPGPGAGSSTDTLEVASCEIVTPGRAWWPWWLGSALLLVIGFVLWRVRTMPESIPQKPRIPIEPSPLAAPALELDRLVAHLSGNYHREDLDLATVALEVGLSAKKVTALLRSQNETFRSALNRLRLTEARRLLTESDLQVSEIAFKVGYANPSHFHRQFRETFGMPPLSVRTDSRKPSKR